MVNEQEVDLLENTVIDLFQVSYFVHQSLGEEGKNVSQTNSFGENTLKADWKSEEVFIKGCAKTRIPIVITSEEHGEVILGENPQYRGILDGIDGTNAYRMGTGRYGTMFAVFDGINPRYQDYLIAGILEYPSGRLLMSAKNHGAFIYEGSEIKSVHTSGKERLDLQTRIYIDGGFKFNQQYFVPKFKTFNQLYVGNMDNRGVPWGASSIYYFDLITGQTDVVVESTRKRNLEIAVAYGILKEVGGIMVDEKGKDIGHRRYLKWGQEENDYLPVISTATKNLANDVTKLLRD